MSIHTRIKSNFCVYKFLIYIKVIIYQKERDFIIEFNTKYMTDTYTQNVSFIYYIFYYYIYRDKNYDVAIIRCLLLKCPCFMYVNKKQNKF